MPGIAKNLETLRRLCLSLPEVEETDHWGHPNFKAGKKTFAAYEWSTAKENPGRPMAAFRLDGPERDAVMLDPAFFDPPHSQGRWVALWADEKIDGALLADMVMRSYRAVALRRMLKALEG